MDLTFCLFFLLLFYPFLPQQEEQALPQWYVSLSPIAMKFSRDFCIFIIICSAQLYKARSIVWFCILLEKLCGFVFMFPKLSFSRSWCLDSHELISTNIASGRLRKAALLIKSIPPYNLTPTLIQVSTPFYSQREFLCNWCQPSQRWARESGPANKLVPSIWSWLAHGWSTWPRPGQGDSILGFSWSIWRGGLPVLCGCGTWGWKPRPIYLEESA